ncbi:MAG: alpha-E domain-containing protein [Chloroherpetonaceae bacterium]|nr:alpha-E domain-containing protein [Chloroherpetonaceae bacterium]
MLSRVANSFYWIARYIERAENYARFISVNLNLIPDLPSGSGEQWEPLIFTSGDQELFKERYGEPSRENVIRFLTFDESNPNSIFSCIHSARENARTIRENLPSELFEQINKYYLSVQNTMTHNRFALSESATFYSEIRNASHLVNGISDSCLTHTEGWHFLNIGRLLERADKASRLLDVKYFILLPSVSTVGTPFDLLQWSALLKSISAFQMYHKKYSKSSPQTIAEFILLDREFPRSIHYCLIHAETSLRQISGSEPSNETSLNILLDFSNIAQKKLGLLRSELDIISIEEIFNFGLHEYLDKLQIEINNVGLAIHETFFSPN